MVDKKDIRKTKDGIVEQDSFESNASNAQITAFDLQTVYNNELEPLIRKMGQVCATYKLPMFVSCCVKNTKEGSLYKNNAVTADTHGMVLAHDYFPDFLRILLGGKATVFEPPKDDFDYEVDATKMTAFFDDGWEEDN